MKLKLFKRAPRILGRLSLGWNDYVEILKYGPFHYVLKSKHTEVHYKGLKANKEMHRELVARMERGTR